MVSVILRQKAINDLNSIWDYTFDKWSENQADFYYNTIYHLRNSVSHANYYFDNKNNSFTFMDKKPRDPNIQFKMEISKFEVGNILNVLEGELIFKFMDKVQDK